MGEKDNKSFCTVNQPKRLFLINNAGNFMFELRNRLRTRFWKVLSILIGDFE